jgi:serine/threonine protein kinase
VLFVSTTSTTTSFQSHGNTSIVSLPSSTRIKCQSCRHFCDSHGNVVDGNLSDDDIVIDFGGATYDDDPKKGTIINTRQYRGPEVTLEVGWSYPSDIWCVGCIIAEAYSGDLLFPAVGSFVPQLILTAG